MLARQTRHLQKKFFWYIRNEKLRKAEKYPEVLIYFNGERQVPSESDLNTEVVLLHNLLNRRDLLGERSIRGAVSLIRQITLRKTKGDPTVIRQSTDLSGHNTDSSLPQNALTPVSKDVP